MSKIISRLKNSRVSLSSGTLHVAVAIPCYNEEVTIAKVISDFKEHLPNANIYVFNNNSSDKSAEKAIAAGAVVYNVPRQGKGSVMRAIFDALHDVDALIVVDGDATYSASEAERLLQPIFDKQADMVVGDRLKKADQESLKQLHQFGNRVIVDTINCVFGTKYEDVLSGYRVFSRRFLKSVPLLAPGFETETEVTLQALEEGLDVVEIPISYAARPKESKSKLRPFKDGWRIMMTAAMLLRDHHPLRLYGLLSLACFFVVAVFGILRILSYRGITMFPDSFVTGMILLMFPAALMLLGIGLILSAVNTRLREIKQVMRRNRKS